MRGYQSQLLGLSATSLMVVICGAVAANNGVLPQKYSLGAMLIGAGIGLFVLAAIAERFLAGRLHESKSAKLFGVALAGLATFVAHGAAVGEVNAIFPLDASNFPHATAAASALVIVGWLFWAFVAVLGTSAASFIFGFSKSNAARTLISAGVALSSVIVVSIISHQIYPEEARRNNLYQVALAMDFNKRHHCVGVPAGSEGVVFVGPEQRLALVAPPREAFRAHRLSLFVQLKVPADFQSVNCNVPPPCHDCELPRRRL